MNEQSKSHHTRLRNGDYSFLKGNVLDIGCGPDPIVLPPPSTVRGWDLADGDAQYLAGVEKETFDVVYSSHAAEHMEHPPTALKNWARVVKEGGYVYFTVPSFTFYEKLHDFTFPGDPSKFNDDHKTSWDLIDVGHRPKNHPHYDFKRINEMGKAAGLTLVDLRIELDHYDFRRPTNEDQTLGPALCQLCVIFQKL